MSTPEERRDAYIRAHLPDTWSTAETEVARRAAAYKYDDFLKHFDETEPAVADAIRYGLKQFESDWLEADNTFVIDYPDGVKPS